MGLSHCGRSGWWTARTVRASKSARCSAATSKDIVSCGPHTVLLTGTFSSREICLVDSADSSRVKIGVLFGSKLKEHRELRSTNCRCVHSWNCPRVSAATEKVPHPDPAD